MNKNSNNNNSFSDGGDVARVCSQERGLYVVEMAGQQCLAEISGKMRYRAEQPTDLPVVGDYVRVSMSSARASITDVLPRKSLVVRKKAGTDRSQQAIAANVDVLFVCMSLNNDFNLRRLERYLSVAWESGATPVVVLTKRDLCRDLASVLVEVGGVAAGVDVIAVSSLQAEGEKALLPYLKSGTTVAFIGSSGVGKSTLINKLIGTSELRTNGLRNDDKGRHTTTSRRLLALPCGAFVIDTPGMRELGMWAADDGLDRTFADIEEFAMQCRFADCTHATEPSCAVRRAIADGTLSQERLDSYRKLLAENDYNKDSDAYLAAKRKKFKQISKYNKKQR